jgi:hypothetical protein
MGLHRPIVLVLVVVLDCFPRRADRGGRRRPRGRLGKIPPLFRARPRRRARLFPRRADRGRRRPRARSGKIPPLLFSCSSSSSCSIISPPRGPRTTTTTSTIWKNPAASFFVLVLVVVLDCFPRRTERARARPRARSGKIPPLLFSCSSSSSCSIAFLAGQNEHEHDLEKSRRFFFCARPRRHARLLSSPDRTRTTASTSTSTIEERASPL